MEYQDPVTPEEDKIRCKMIDEMDKHLKINPIEKK